MNDEIRVLSVNCQGLRDFKKRYDVLEYLNSSDANIFCLQDTHWLSKDVKLIKQTWNGECLVHGVSTNSRGMAILFKKILNTKFCLTIMMTWETLFLLT